MDYSWITRGLLVDYSGTSIVGTAPVMTTFAAPATAVVVAHFGAASSCQFFYGCTWTTVMFGEQFGRSVELYSTTPRMQDGTEDSVLQQKSSRTSHSTTKVSTNDLINQLTWLTFH